jgi:molybdopterin converting factor small subunit
VRLTGRILVGGRRPRPLAGAWAVVHRVTREGGGPVDSTRTDAAGRYALRLATVDSLAIYVVSGWYAGLAYFSEPLQLAGRTSAEVSSLTVYDTTSHGPAIAVRQRVLTIARPRADGSRDVLEIVRLHNPGQATLVTADTAHPVWTGALPHEAIQWRVGESDVSAETVLRRGDSVAVFAPLSPGEPGKQLSYGYVLPSDVRTLRLPVDQETGEIGFLLEDTAAVVTAPALQKLTVDSIENRWFARYRTGPLAAGSVVLIALPRGRFHPQRAVPYLVGVIALVLAAGLIVALRRKAGAAPLASNPDSR